jgi:hypothetical protein
MSFSTEIERYRQVGTEFVLAARGSSNRHDEGRAGNWNTAMIAHHLADADMHFAIRIREVLVHQNPALIVFDEERYAERLDYARRPIEPALLLIKSIHEETADLLLELPETAWSRTGTRADGAVFTLGDLVKKTTDHAQEHIEQIRSAP